MEQGDSSLRFRVDWKRTIRVRMIDDVRARGGEYVVEGSSTIRGLYGTLRCRAHWDGVVVRCREERVNG